MIENYFIMLVYSILHSLQVHFNSHKQPQKCNDNITRSRFINYVNLFYIIFLVSVFQFTQKLNYCNTYMIEILIMLIYFILHPLQTQLSSHKSQ